MKKQFIFIVIFSAIVLGLGFSSFARAALLPNSKENTNTITPADLGVNNVGTLPTSPFYIFKEWGRGIQRFFTFNPVAKAKLELKITNEKAAELLEVEKAKPNDAGALTKALDNYTNAQERLNSRITAISADSNDAKLVKLLKDVDDKTAKHAVLLEQLTQTWYSTGAGEQNITDAIDNALNNTLKTFTVTVTSVNDAPTLQQKATDEIAKATEAIKQAETVFGQPVTFTANIVDDRGAGFIKSIAAAHVDFFIDSGEGIILNTSGGGFVDNKKSVTVTSVGVPILFLNIIVKEICADENHCTSAMASTTGKAYTASTGSDGSYKFTGLAPGKYDIFIGGQMVKSITVGTEGTISGTVIYSDNHGEFRSSTTAVINGGDLLISVTTTAGLAVGNIIRIDNELMLVTAMAPTSITVERGANGSTAGAHLSGAIITNICGRGMYGCLFPQFLTAIPSIANAKGHLASAKEAFADGKYGEAYGLARSAEAIATSINGTIDLDNQAAGKDYGDKTAPTPSPTASPKQSPKSAPAPTSEPTPEPTPSPASGENSAGNPMGNGAAGR